MYYLFSASRTLDMVAYEGFLRSVLPNDFYFTSYNTRQGYIETDTSISDTLYTSIPIMNEDLGCSITILSTPTLSSLTSYLLNDLQGLKPSGYLSLADACLLALLQRRDEVMRKGIFDHFKGVDPKLMEDIITFVRCGCNVINTSRILYLHRNTMNYRIRKFQDLMGMNLRNEEDVQFIRLYALLKENGM